MVTQGSHWQEAETASALKSTASLLLQQASISQGSPGFWDGGTYPVCMLAGGEDLQPLTHVRKQGSHPKE